MPFTQDDFFVGMIAYFTVNDLRRHALVRSSHTTRDTKPRPFVCYAEADGDCYWTSLTGTPNPQRRAVDRQFLRYPCGRFLAGDLIIHDGRTSFAGPIEVFASLSRRHDEFDGYRRPHLTREGVDAVETIMRARGGLLPAAQPSQALVAA